MTLDLYKIWWVCGLRVQRKPNVYDSNCICLVRPRGLEPLTLSMSTIRSNQLSYGRRINFKNFNRNELEFQSIYPSDNIRV